MNFLKYPHVIMKTQAWGQVFGTAVKMCFRMSTFHCGIPVFKSQPCLQFQLPANVHPWRYQEYLSNLDPITPGRLSLSSALICFVLTQP